MAEQIRQMKTPDRPSRAFLFRAPLASFLFGLFAAWSGIFVPYAIGASAQDQTVQSTHSSELSMRQHYDAAYRFQSSGDLAQARLEYELFLADALHQVGNGRANIREYARALPLYEEALELAPANFTLNFDYAAAALEAEDPSKAKLLLEQALNLYSKSAKGSDVASAHLILGRALQKTNGYSEAVEQFKEAVSIDPSFVNMYALGAAYLTLPDKESATRTFAEILSRFGDTAAMHMDLGRAYGESGYPDEAIQEFKKAIAKNDKLPGAHYSLADGSVSSYGSFTGIRLCPIHGENRRFSEWTRVASGAGADRSGKCDVPSGIRRGLCKQWKLSQSRRGVTHGYHAQSSRHGDKICTGAQPDRSWAKGRSGGVAG
jgi:tetratricopeptide (TPR) repeat protein